MNTQKTDFSETSQTDYLTVRANIENQASGFEMTDDVVSLSSQVEKKTCNQNLSSVLSQIQDEGPARNKVTLNSSKNNNLINLKHKHRNFDTDNLPGGAGENNQIQTDAAAELDQINSSVTAATDQAGNKLFRLSAILFITLFLIACYFFYRMDARTNQLEGALDTHKSSIQSSIKNYNDSLTPDIRSINDLLQVLQRDLEKIKAGNLLADSNVDSIKEDNVVTVSSVVSINEKEDVVKLNSVIQSLKNELNSVKAVDFDSSPEKIEANEVTTTVRSGSNNVIKNQWTVNLGSFTKKESAIVNITKLTSSGYAASIELAEVNGNLVYRLIVSGFDRYREAVLFVDVAAEKFDLTGGWIRKSSIKP